MIKSINIKCQTKDQGWGNEKGCIEIKLCRGKQVNQSNYEWAKDGSGDFENTIARSIVNNANHNISNVNVTFDLDSNIINQYQIGD